MKWFIGLSVTVFLVVVGLVWQRSRQHLPAIPESHLGFEEYEGLKNTDSTKDAVANVRSLQLQEEIRRDTELLFDNLKKIPEADKDGYYRISYQAINKFKAHLSSPDTVDSDKTLLKESIVKILENLKAKADQHDQTNIQEEIESL